MNKISVKNFISYLCVWILISLAVSAAFFAHTGSAAESVEDEAGHRHFSIEKIGIPFGYWEGATEAADLAAGTDASADAGFDAGVDAEAGKDVGAGAGLDAGVDAGAAASSDAGLDAGVDAGAAASAGAGFDAGVETDLQTGTEQELALPSMIGIGQTGEEVSFVQELLNILGYSTGEESGVFGSTTEEAVKAYQADREIYPDGLVGPVTMGALIDEIYNNPKDYTGLVQMPTSGRWAFVCDGLYTDDPSAMILTTEDEEAGLKEEFCEVYAKNVVDRITTPEMTEEEMIDACFQFTLNEFESTNHPRVPHYTGSDWVYVYAYDMFGPRHGGNCFSYAAAFSVLAKACGIEEVYCCTSGAHAWTEIDGLVYDPEQYHDTDNNKIYAYSYHNPKISNYWPAISTWEENPWMRMKLPAFS